MSKKVHFVYLVVFKMKNGEEVFITCNNEEKDRFLSWFNSDEETTLQLKNDLSSDCVSINEIKKYHKLDRNTISNMVIHQFFELPYVPIRFLYLVCSKSKFCLNTLLKGLVFGLFLVFVYSFYLFGSDFLSPTNFALMQKNMYDLMKVSLMLIPLYIFLEFAVTAIYSYYMEYPHLLYKYSKLNIYESRVLLYGIVMAVCFSIT